MRAAANGISSLVPVSALIVTSMEPANGTATGNLELSIGATARTYEQSELLARQGGSTIQTTGGDYNRAMTFHAVPLLALIRVPDQTGIDTVEAAATDGFVTHFPYSVLQDASKGGAVPWIAVEDPASPRPNLPGKDHSAGPLYLVWTNTAGSKIGPSQWVQSVASLRGGGVVSDQSLA